MLRLAGMRTGHGKGTCMRHLFMRGMLAVAGASIISPVGAQAPSPAAAPPSWPPPAYYAYGNVYRPYPFPAPTPKDAYRDRLINRWQLEQLTGPTPQALQGPSPNGSRGGDGGGGDRGG